MLVDPSPDLHYHLERLNKKVEGIFITHAHFDHIAGFPELQVFKELDVYSHGQGVEVAKRLASLFLGGAAPKTGNGVITDFRLTSGSGLTGLESSTSGRFTAR